MGLSERKVKQRIGHDPRNLTWSDDKDRFSYKHMSSLGWSDNSGIGGSNLSGNPNHIVVARKLDNSGIGMGRAKKEGDEMASGAGAAGQGLDDVLKRLAEAASRSGTSTPVETVVEVKTEVAPVRNRIASRQKHLHSKRMASQSPAALAEILGVSVASLSPAASPSPAPQVEITETNEVKSGSSTPDDQRTADETISTSTLSVSDYFRQKMREKMLARHAASGMSNAELPEGSLARVKEEVKVAVGGVEWEGSRVTFAEVKEEDVKPDDKPDIKPTPSELKIASQPDIKPVLPTETEDVKPVLSKEERRRQKEEKRLRKEAKRASKLEKGESKRKREGEESDTKKKSKKDKSS